MKNQNIIKPIIVNDKRGKEDPAKKLVEGVLGQLEREAELKRKLEKKQMPFGHNQKALNEIPVESIISVENKKVRARKYKLDKRASYTSYIEPEEVEEAITAVESAIGFEIPRTAAYFITIKLHVDEFKDGKAKDEQGNKTSIDLPDAVLDKYKERERFRACSGLVIGIGPDAFDPERFPNGPVCRVGDFVTFKLHNADQSMYRGYAICTLPDDKVMYVIEDPDYVSKD